MSMEAKIRDAIQLMYEYAAADLEAMYGNENPDAISIMEAACGLDLVEHEIEKDVYIAFCQLPYKEKELLFKEVID